MRAAMSGAASGGIKAGFEGSRSADCAAGVCDGLLPFPPQGEACAYETPYRVLDDVFCIRARNPSPIAFEGTNTWVIHPEDASSCAIVDPGCNSSEHLSAIEAFVRSRGARIAEVVVTHSHPDHVSGADELARENGARLLMGGNGIGCEGRLGLCEGRVGTRVYMLPGHSSDSIALLLEDDAALISGDIFFSRGWSVIPVPGGNLADYFKTLARLQSLIGQGEAAVVLPGHREAMGAAYALSRLDDYVAHRRHRLDEIRAVADEIGSRDIEAVARKVYADIADPELYKAALMSLASQIEYLNLTDGFATA